MHCSLPLVSGNQHNLGKFGRVTVHSHGCDSVEGIVVYQYQGLCSTTCSGMLTWMLTPSFLMPCANYESCVTSHYLLGLSFVDDQHAGLRACCTITHLAVLLHTTVHGSRKLKHAISYLLPCQRISVHSKILLLLSESQKILQAICSTATHLGFSQFFFFYLLWAYVHCTPVMLLQSLPFTLLGRFWLGTII